MIPITVKIKLPFIIIGLKFMNLKLLSSIVNIYGAVKNIKKRKIAGVVDLHLRWLHCTNTFNLPPGDGRARLSICPVLIQ